MGIYERIAECNRLGTVMGMPDGDFDFVWRTYGCLVASGRHVPAKGTMTGAVKEKYTPEELEALYARWKVERND